MTQDKQPTNKKARHEARFEAVAQTASDSIVISDEHSKIIFANKRTCEIFGYTEQALLGAELGVLMPQKYRKAHNAGVQRFIETGSPTLIGHTIEIEGLRKDGSVFPLELSLSAWKEQGSYFFSGIIRDVSKRKEVLKEKEEINHKLQERQEELEALNEELRLSQEELQKAEEKLRKINEGLENSIDKRTKELAESEREVSYREEQLRLLTDAMPVRIAYLKNDKTYDFVNKAYEKTYKRKREEIVGVPMWEIIGVKAYKNKQPLIERALKGEYIEKQMLQEYGELGKKWIKVSMIPHHVKGKIAGIFSLIEDISEFKNIQIELEEKNHELIKINTDLDNFIYTVSHDLKSPISNMEGLLGLLRKSDLEKVEPKGRQVLEMLDASVQKLRKTIGDLVEITRDQKEIEGAVGELVRFEEVSKEVKEDVFELFPLENALIKEDFQVEEVNYKKANLRSILYNLLSNAIKYRNPDNPLVVRLKTYKQDGFVVLSVKDNGLGLSKNQQKKLFTLFRRMHQHVEGTGVGLFMIKRIVENNGGRIEVNSEEGKGTEFLVFLAKT